MVSIHLCAIRRHSCDDLEGSTFPLRTYIEHKSRQTTIGKVIGVPRTPGRKCEDAEILPRQRAACPSPCPEFGETFVTGMAA